MFAIAAFGVISAADTMGALNRKMAVFGRLMSLAAATVTLSRSSLFGVVATFGIYHLLNYRVFRK